MGVILFAVMTIGFAPSKASHPDANAPENAAQPTDATGQPVSDDDLKLIANLIG